MEEQLTKRYFDEQFDALTRVVREGVDLLKARAVPSNADVVRARAEFQIFPTAP